MKRKTQHAVAWSCVVGVMSLSVCVGVMPNVALMESGDWRVMWLGVIMTASIPVMEAAAALLAYTILSSPWRLTKRLALAVLTLSLALAWNGYNVKRGLEMAPSALNAQSNGLLAQAAERREYANQMRSTIQKAHETGAYINTTEVDRSISRAEREAVEMETRAATMAPPSIAMLIVLTLAMKAIEITLLYVVSRKHQAPAIAAVRRRKRADKVPALVFDRDADNKKKQQKSEDDPEDALTSWLQGK